MEQLWREAQLAEDGPSEHVSPCRCPQIVVQHVVIPAFLWSLLPSFPAGFIVLHTSRSSKKKDIRVLLLDNFQTVPVSLGLQEVVAIDKLDVLACGILQSGVAGD